MSTPECSKQQLDYMAAKTAFDALQSDANRALMHEAAYRLFSWAGDAILTLQLRPGQRFKVREVVKMAMHSGCDDNVFKEFVEIAMDLPGFV